MSKIVDLIQSKNSNLILVDDIPKPCKVSDYYLINVVKNGEYSFCNVSRNDSIQDRKPLSIMYRKLALKPNVKYVDFHSELCPDKTCGVVSPLNKEKLLYIDSSPHFYEESKDILSSSWLKILKN